MIDLNFFYTINIKRLKQVLLIVGLAFFTAWGLFISELVYKPTVSTKEGAKAIYKGEKDIALTFNIGWGDEKAEPILNTLEEEKVKSATFFLAGSWAERHPELVKRIIDLGYEVGILGYEYKDYTKIKEEEIRRDINNALTAFNKLNVKNIEFIRAPTGNFNEATLKIAEQFGLTVIHWSVDSHDWTNPGVESIVSNVKKAKQGDIILLHASDAAKQTAAALPEIVKYFNNQKLKLVTISELIANAKTESHEIK